MHLVKECAVVKCYANDGNIDWNLECSVQGKIKQLKEVNTYIQDNLKNIMITKLFQSPGIILDIVKQVGQLGHPQIDKNTSQYYKKLRGESTLQEIK